VYVIPRRDTHTHIKAFEYSFIFLSGRDKQISSNLPFVAMSITFLPGKISSEKRCRRRSIAELRAFDGSTFFKKREASKSNNIGSKITTNPYARGIKYDIVQGKDIFQAATLGKWMDQIPPRGNIYELGKDGCTRGTPGWGGGEGGGHPSYLQLHYH
jgi:hypothetical protein